MKGEKAPQKLIVNCFKLTPMELEQQAEFEAGTGT